MSETKTKHHSKLGQFASTAIAGNDVLSSCLYVSGFAILFAGIWAPLVFFAIVLVLWLYKYVYTEVVEALPLNGGAYNCLLNATGKSFAAVAGVMTVLSYIATSVISAKTASEYVHTIFTGMPVLTVTALIIVAFAALTIAGVKDSARVAQVIFAFHIFVLVLFISLGLLNFFNTRDATHLNFNFMQTMQNIREMGSFKMIFFAFAASLLGVSGFESSANFVEEQENGVFRKTLRNMLIGVWIFNPLITFVILSIMPYGQILGAKDFLLSSSALLVGGKGLQYLVVADAFLVLSGAVLASFVGVSGLLYRMTIDHCLPSTLLLPKLKRRNQNTSRIIIVFAVLCISILLMTHGELASLAGVYTISFLGVMTTFAIGNVVLRITRPDLKRTYHGTIIITILASLMTILGVAGNIMIDPKNFLYFLAYFLPAVAIVQTMVYRDYVLEGLLSLTKHWQFLYNWVHPWFEHVIRPRIVVFAHHPDKLYRVIEYIRVNETSRRIAVVYCEKSDPHGSEMAQKFREYIAFFKEAKIFPHLEIDLVVEKELEFGPDLVKTYANRYHIMRNNIFIGSIHESHEFSFDELGGVRIVQ